MELEFLEKDNSKLSFVISNTSTAFVNSLRRTILSFIPIPAFDTVSIYENSSNLFDEFIAHRIGLIPIDARELAMGEKVGFVLDEEGPKTVMSGDMKGPNDVKLVYDNIPIITLQEGQRLRLDAEAAWGIAKQHAKFQSALASYKQYPTLSKKDLNPRAVDACPRKALKINGKELILDPIKCNMCDECKEVSKGAVEVVGSEDKFVFYLESFGNRDAMDVLHESLNIIEGMCDEFLSKM